MKIRSLESPDQGLSINRSFGTLWVSFKSVCHWPKFYRLSRRANFYQWLRKIQEELKAKNGCIGKPLMLFTVGLIINQWLAMVLAMNDSNIMFMFVFVMMMMMKLVDGCWLQHIMWLVFIAQWWVVVKMKINEEEWWSDLVWSVCWCNWCDWVVSVSIVRREVIVSLYPCYKSIDEYLLIMWWL